MQEDTIEIYTLWDRVKKRFSLVRSQPKSFTLKDTVQPVTSMDFITSSINIETVEIWVTAVAFEWFYTVPDNKRWLVHYISVHRTSGTATFSHILLQASQDVIAGAVVPLKTYALATQTTDDYYLPHAMPLAAGDRIGIKIDTFAANGNWDMHLVYDELDIEE